MYEFYNNIPFGVIILKGNPLGIEYLNNRIKIMLNLDDNIDYKNHRDLDFLKYYNYIIEDCYKLQKEHAIKNAEIFHNKFFSISICGKESQVELYIQDTTDDVLSNRKSLENSKLNLEKERERFLNISTELKTKCDIIEILRDREKEHLMHLRDVINNISEGLIVIDKIGKFSLCNRAAYNITGLSMGELFHTSAITKKYYIYDAEQNGSDINSIYDSIFNKFIPVKNFVARLVDKNTYVEKYIEFNSNPIFNKDKEVIYTILTLKDVTETKLHQISAEEHANFVKHVVNTLEVPIAVIDYPALTYKLINEEHKNISKNLKDMDIDFDDIIGLPFNEIIGNYSDYNLNDLLDKVGKTGKEFTISPYSILDENSKERFYKFKFTPYKDINGRVTRIHIHGLDITEEVNHNMELEKITKLKDEFFTVISHELRTPLTIIYSSLQLAYDIYKEEITYNVDKILGRINQNCSRLLKLINNILDLSKAEAGFLTINNSYFDIVYLTENIVSSTNLYAKSKGIELVFDTNEEEALVCLDKDKYERILLNLLSNAVKFTPDGKQILVSTEIDNDKIILKVKDEGIGIPKDKLDYIFDRFAQVNTSLSRRAEGTGIGLSLVKKLVEYMDGKIEVLSEEGRGSEFIIQFNKLSVHSNSELTSKTIGSNLKGKVDIEFSDIN